MQLAIDVDKADFVKHLRQPGALLRQKAGILLVAFPVFQVNFLVGDVEIAADDNLPAGLSQFNEVRQKQLQKPEFGSLPLLPRRAGWLVDRDHREIGKVTLDVAPFGVKFLRAEADDHFARLLPGINAGAAIALFLGVMEVPLEFPRRQEIRRHVCFLGLEFLHAQKIGLLRCQPFEASLLRRRANAVEVE